MAQEAEQYDARRELLDILLTRVQGERSRSSTDDGSHRAADGPGERSIYAQVLMDKIRHDPHPSLPMMRRVLALG